MSTNRIGARLLARLRVLLALLGVAGLSGLPVQAQAAVPDARSQLEARVEAARSIINKATDATPDEAGDGSVAQWFNWPNWSNWGNWPNWGNWGNWFNR